MNDELVKYILQHDTSKKICDIAKLFGIKSETVMKAYNYGLKHKSGFGYTEAKPSKEKFISNKNNHGEKAVVMIGSDGIEIATYKSLTDAAGHIGGYQASISESIKRNKPYKGYMWRFADV